jgi:hypothetical protein
MHMQGLERIIRLRGGFQGLSDFSPLFASWYVRFPILGFGPLDSNLLRFDITNSAVQDKPPRFSYPVKFENGPATLEELSSSLITLLAKLDGTDGNLSSLGAGLGKMAQLTSYINRHGQQPQFWKADVETALLVVGPAAHCILSIPREFPMHIDDDASFLPFLLQETVRLALLILLATLKKAFSFVADELGLFLERFSTLTPLMSGLCFYPELRLWAHLVVACVREDPIPQLQTSEIRRAMRELQFPKIEDAVIAAKSLIWINNLLDREIESFKRQMDQYSTVSNNAGSDGIPRCYIQKHIVCKYSVLRKVGFEIFQDHKHR